MSAEDFRRKLQHRPQDIQAQRAAEAARAQQAQIEAGQRATSAKLQHEEQNQQKITILQKAGQILGIEFRIQTMAETIGSQIIQAIEQPKKEEFRIRYDIPYHQFSGRPIIEDPTLSESTWASGGMGGPSGGTYYGEKLGSQMTLVDSLGLSLTCPSALVNGTFCISLDFYHVYWTERELQWTRVATKIFSESRGWQQENDTINNFQLYYLNGKITQIHIVSGKYSDEQYLDEKYLNDNFLRLYDVYLNATDQI